MKIGIIGTSDSADEILKVINKYYPLLEPIVYKKEKVFEVLEIINECVKKTDGILFTGCAVSGEVEKYMKIDKPYETIMRSDSSIMKAFWNIRNDGIQIKRISVDVVEKELIEEAADEFGIKIENIYAMPYNSDMTEDDYIKKHTELWKEGKVDIILTALGSVYNNLKEKGFPVYRLGITVSLIKSSVDNLIGKITTKQIKANQIGIQILKIKNVKQDITAAYDDLIIKNMVEKELINYIKEVNGSIFQLGKNEYIMFSTRRTLGDARIINYFQRLTEDFQKKGITLYSGMGFGNTGWNAEYNARNALEMAQKKSKAAFYIIDEDNNIRGPVNSHDETNYNLCLYDEEIRNIAKKIGISATYLSKISSIIENNNENVFSSDTLSHYLSVTERSARRILSKFVDSGYGKVVSTTVSKGVGRPKKIIKIEL